MSYFRLLTLTVISLILTLTIIPICYTQEPLPAFATKCSWYSQESCRREGTSGINADGTRFDDTDFSCASWDYPFGTSLLVTNPVNQKSVIVVVKDRGPAKRLYRQGRKLDLSKSAFKSIAPLKLGVITVRVREL